MSMLDSLKEALAEGRTIRPVEEGIYSALSWDAHKYRYDQRAALYDLIVGTQLYNRVMWGDSPLNYTVFARQAVSLNPSGQFLDAGCGSLLFTAEVYLECGRQVIALQKGTWHMQSLISAVKRAQIDKLYDSLLA